MTASFEADRAGIARMLNSGDMERMLVRVARRAKGYAESIAPVDTGRYKHGRRVLDSRNDPNGARRAGGGQFDDDTDTGPGGFHVTSGRGTGGGTAWARLSNPTPYAIYLEYGTRYMRAQRILRRSIDAMRA